jgi:hypothetical protein
MKLVLMVHLLTPTPVVRNAPQHVPLVMRVNVLLVGMVTCCLLVIVSMYVQKECTMMGLLVRNVLSFVSCVWQLITAQLV